MRFKRKLELIRLARQVRLPDDSEVAGDLGEQDALLAVQRTIRVRRAHCRCYPAIRIPRPGESQGKSEVDLLIVSPYALVGLEVKNWGGHIEVGRNGAWRQNKGREDIREHQDPALLVEGKMATLREWISTKNDVEVEPSLVHSFVVLTNPSLSLGPRVSRCDRLVRIHELERILAPLVNPNRPGPWPRLRRLIGLERTIPTAIPDVPRVVEAANRLPTWDLVHLHGGKTLRGDVLRPEIALASRRPLRRDVKRVDFHIPRRYFPGLIQSSSASWSDWDGTRGRGQLRPGQRLVIRLAGQGRDEEVPLETIERIVFGRRDDSAYDRALKEGDVFEGTVKDIKDFGIFVGLDRGRDGLVHVTRLRRHGLMPSSFLPGASVEVEILSITVVNGRQRIALDLGGSGKGVGNPLWA
jgi:hypothetical protein